MYLMYDLVNFGVGNADQGLYFFLITNVFFLILSCYGYCKSSVFHKADKEEREKLFINTIFVTIDNCHER